jgi:hypothetical protein
VTERIQSVREFLDLLHLEAAKLTTSTKPTSFYRPVENPWNVFGQTQINATQKSRSNTNQWF